MTKKNSKQFLRQLQERYNKEVEEIALKESRFDGAFVIQKNHQTFIVGSLEDFDHQNKKISDLYDYLVEEKGYPEYYLASENFDDGIYTLFKRAEDTKLFEKMWKDSDQEDVIRYLHNTREAYISHPEDLPLGLPPKSYSLGNRNRLDSQEDYDEGVYTDPEKVNIQLDFTLPRKTSYTPHVVFETSVTGESLTAEEKNAVCNYLQEIETDRSYREGDDASVRSVFQKLREKKRLNFNPSLAARAAGLLFLEHFVDSVPGTPQEKEARKIHQLPYWGIEMAIRHGFQRAYLESFYTEQVTKDVLEMLIISTQDIEYYNHEQAG